MSCNKKKEEEIIKKINVEQEFADLNFKEMRSKRFGLTSCCPLDKLEKISTKKEICDWDEEKLPVYLSRDYKDEDIDPTYKWLFESQPIPDWVVKACRPCTEYDDNVTFTGQSMTFTMPESLMVSAPDYVQGTSKVYFLTPYDGAAANTWLTVGYGVIPATGDFEVTIYGNTAAADPKNGADNKTPLKIIIDVNGDQSLLRSVDYTTAGWSNNLYENNTNRQASSTGAITTECAFGIATDCTFCGEARKADPDMYFFYDTTSLGRQEVIDTHNVVNNWITGLRDIGAFNGKVYHTSVLGERWLDWAIVPYTGTFNNAGFCGGVGSPGLGSSGVIGPQNPNWASGTGGYVDAVTPLTSNTTLYEWGVLDYFINQKQVEWFNAGDTTTTATYTGPGASGDAVTSPGPPPKATSKRILVVVFADEATSPVPYNQPYHVTTSNTQPSWIEACGGANGTTTAPTPCWNADYNKFVIEHNKFQAKGSDYRADYFIYPAYPVSPNDSHNAFPLHVVGAIESGPTGNGLLNTPPVNGLVDLLQTAVPTNPYVANGKGRLDQYNWGYNVSQPATGFKQIDFVTNLEGFWDPGDEECVDDAECISIYVKDNAGNPIECYPIVVDGKEVGYTNEDGYYLHKIKNASVDTKHSIDLCHCFETTGGCSQQRIDIIVTPEETKVVCTPLKVDCT